MTRENRKMSDVTVAPQTNLTAGVTRQLARLRGRLTTWLWLYGLSRLLWFALALFALDLALDWFFRMDRPQRGVMLALLLGLLALAVYRKLFLPLSASASDDALCLQVEAKNRGLAQSVISALQLSRMEDVESRGMSPVMVGQTIRSGAEAAEQVDFRNVLDEREFRFNGVLAVIAVAAVLAIGIGAARNDFLGTWASRNLLLSQRTWPQQTYLIVQRAEDGKVVFPRGEDWTQVVAVTPESLVVPETIYIDFRRSRGRNSQAMKRVAPKERQFAAIFANVIEPFEFRARGGDAVTPWIRVELVEQPGVEELALAVTPPKYTKQSVHTLPPGKGPYYVLPGSSLEIQGRANKPLKSAALAVEDSSHPLALADAQTFSGEISAGKLIAGQYRFELEDTLGLTARRPTTFGLRIRVDREPRVRARLVGVSGMVVSKARVPLSARISDDFGITGAQIQYQWRGDDAEKRDGSGTLAIEQLKDKFGAADLSFDEALELGPLAIPAGAGLTFHLAATDNDDISGPNTGKSSDFLLRVVTEEELRTDLLRREKEQRQEFERLIKNEEDLLTDTRALEAALKGAAALSAEQKDQLRQYQRRQKQIGTSLSSIVERLASIIIEVQNNRLEADGGRLQSRLQNDIVAPLSDIADGGIPLAMQKLDQTRRQSSEAAPRDEALAAAVQTEREIVARMQQVLAHMTDTEGYQEAVNLLYEIQKMQQDVLDRTLKEKQDRIKGILEGKSPGAEK
jgi:hypothetical protein